MRPGRVLIVGAGPVGMATALELARHGARSLVLEQKPALSHVGSRAIVLARHTLQAFSRLGCADEILARGIRLVRSRTFFRDVELSRVDFPGGNGLPPFINLQQTHTERALLHAAERSALIEMDFASTVTGLRQDHHGVVLETDHGRVSGAYAIACDGAHSTVRSLLRLRFQGSTCRDRFFIADIHAELPFPKERRFFFDPPSNPRRQVLMHPQPDDQWRLDWQVPVDSDLEAERASGALDRRIRALIGADVEYQLVWATAYRFHQRLVDRFRVGRVFLAGDAAHLMAPFGARGLNSGIEDAANLGWKLALVLAGQAPERLLDSYDGERRRAARVNLRMTAGTARFMAPPTLAHRAFRDAVLRLSLCSQRTRRYVNDVRFTEPAVYARHPNGPVGRPAPIPLEQPPGTFTALVVSADQRTGPALADELGELPLRVTQCSPDDQRARALGAGGEVAYLIRPDGYVTAVTRPSTAPVRTALRAALGG